MKAIKLLRYGKFRFWSVVWPLLCTCVSVSQATTVFIYNMCMNELILMVIVARAALGPKSCVLSSV